MGRSKNENLIKIQQSGKKGSYRITLPVKIVRELGWKEHQKLIAKRSGKKIVINDWPAKKK